jgi:hypothetical protein
MDFLKSIFNGRALTYEELETAINAHNGNESNKESQIKIGNLGSGEYVGKGKHDSEIERLNTLLSGKDADIQTLTSTLEALKKGKLDADGIQQKLADAERLLGEAKAREAETIKKYALRDALREAKAIDVDYLTFKINEKLKGDGKAVELDENEHIKGWDDMLSDLKTQFPSQFEKSNNIHIDPNVLPQPNTNSGISAEEFAKMGYQSRLKLKQENPEAYAQLTGKNLN